MRFSSLNRGSGRVPGSGPQRPEPSRPRPRRSRFRRAVPRPAPQAPADQNRRQAPRAPITIAVKKRVGHRVDLCQASDISADGIFLAQADGQPAPAGQKCWLEFNLPGCEVPICARGRVVRGSDYRSFHLTAVQFRTLAPSHRRLIQRYVEGSPVAHSAPAFLPPRSY